MVYSITSGESVCVWGGENGTGRGGLNELK